MKILFVNDSTVNPNWGDRAAAMALQEMLVETGHEIVARITEDELRESSFWEVPVDDHLPTAPDADTPLADVVRYKVARRRAKRRWRPSIVPLVASRYESALRTIEDEPVRFAPVLGALEAAEAVLIHGDGCITGNGPVPRNELFLAFVAKKLFGLPVHLVNHTADLDHPRLAEMARLVYPMLDGVVYRDAISAERWAGAWPGRYAPDSAFWFRPSAPESWRAACARPGAYDIWPDRAGFDPTRPFVCVGGSSIFSFGEHPTEIVDDFVALVVHLDREIDAQIVLTASDRKDEIVFRDVARRTGLPLVGLRCPVPMVVDLLARAQAYVGGRWHPSIFALANGVPVVPLSSKTFKIPALMGMAGLPDEVFDANDVARGRAAITATLKERLDGGEALRESLLTWGERQRRDAIQNVTGLNPQG